MGSLQGRNILIVDDARDVRILVKRILEGDGATVHEAPDADIALAVLQTRSPHLVITDLAMPGKSGFDLLDLRRSHEAWRNLPMLVLSGKNDLESVSRSIALGANDYILKPLSSTLLLQKVRRALKASSFLTHVFPADRRHPGTKRHGKGKPRRGGMTTNDIEIAKHEHRPRQ